MKKGFTLAEVLITLAIIGVVAALTIPSVILNTQKAEYKTGLKKAVSVLNQAISVEKALENNSPEDATTNTALADMISGRLNVLESNTANCALTDTPTTTTNGTTTITANACTFTTTDGMLFWFPNTVSTGGFCSNPAKTEQGDCDGEGETWTANPTAKANTCTTAAPCFIAVDLNGTKAPNKFGDQTASATDQAEITDRYYLQISGTTVTPAGNLAKEIMYN